jgi:hypothetical protein
MEEDPTNHLDKILEKVTDLYTKYKMDPYMEPKMHNYICNQLSTTLENIERNHTLWLSTSYNIDFRKKK